MDHSQTNSASSDSPVSLAQTNHSEQKQSSVQQTLIETANPIQNHDGLLSALEGLLFLCGEEGLSIEQMEAVLPYITRPEIEEALEELATACQKESRGIELQVLANRWKYVTKPALANLGKSLFENIITPTLSQASLEVLAIIAYKQPITRVEIEELRGVGCEAVLRKLQARDFIEAKDRLDVPGKPLLYTVTDAFLDAFGLESLEDLPQEQVRSEQNTLFDDVHPEEE